MNASKLLSLVAMVCAAQSNLQANGWKELSKAALHKWGNRYEKYVDVCFKVTKAASKTVVGTSLIATPSVYTYAYFKELEALKEGNQANSAYYGALKNASLKIPLAGLTSATGIAVSGLSVAATPILIPTALIGGTCLEGVRGAMQGALIGTETAIEIPVISLLLSSFVAHDLIANEFKKTDELKNMPDKCPYQVYMKNEK